MIRGPLSYDMGYNNVAIVTQVGAEVTRFKPGDRVYSIAPHTSEAVFEQDGVLARIPDGVDMEDAVFTHLLSLGLHALRRGNFTPGSRVAVIGMGVIGLYTVAFAKSLGAKVLAVGRGAERLRVARADAENYWKSVRARRNVWESHPTKTTQRRALSPTTLHNHLRAARTFWNEMMRQQVVAYNPFDHIKPPKDKRPAVMKAITTDDLRAIWQAALRSNPRDFAIITVMATSGVRAGELVSMNFNQLDLRQGIAWVKGKRRWRKVFLGKASVQAIQAYINARPTHKGDAIWLNVFGQPLTTDGMRQLVDRLAAKGKITGRHNLHAFRHRAAQAWLDQGINAQIVAQALSHADVTVTLLIYGNQDDRRVAKAIHQAEMAPFEEPPSLADLELEEITNLLTSPTAS